MAKYESKYSELGFYVDDQVRKFSNGVYTTEDAKEIEVLDALVDAVKVEEPAEEAEAKPAAKAKGASKK